MSPPGTRSPPMFLIHSCLHACILHNRPWAWPCARNWENSGIRQADGPWAASSLTSSLATGSSLSHFLHPSTAQIQPLGDTRSFPAPTPYSLSGSHGRKGAGAQAERVQPIVPMGPHPPATALSVCRRCRGARAGYKNQIWADRPFPSKAGPVRATLLPR